MPPPDKRRHAVAAAGGAGLALHRQPPREAAWGVVRDNAAREAALARGGRRPPGHHPELDRAALRAADGGLIPPTRPPAATAVGPVAVGPRDVTRLCRASPAAWGALPAKADQHSRDPGVNPTVKSANISQGLEVTSGRALPAEASAEASASAQALGPSVGCVESGAAEEGAGWDARLAEALASSRAEVPRGGEESGAVVYATLGGALGLVEARRLRPGEAAVLQHAERLGLMLLGEHSRRWVDNNRLLEALGLVPAEVAPKLPLTWL